MSVDCVDVPHQVAIEFGLAVLVVADGDVQLGDRLAGHDRLEERHQLARAMDLDVKVGPGEAEDDAHLVGRQQGRVDDDALLFVVQGQGQGHGPVTAGDPADEIGPLVAVEDGIDHVDGVDRQPVARALRSRSMAAATRWTSRSRSSKGTEKSHASRTSLISSASGRLAGYVRSIGGLGFGRSVEVGEEELDPGIDADRGEDPPADRVEERLGQLDVLAVPDLLGVGLLHRRPELLVPLRDVQQLPDPLDDSRR